MKLELKHLSAYLPYGLMCELKDQKKIKIAKLCGAYIDNSYAFFDTVESEHGYDGIKPILRPLSDLTKDENFYINFCDMFISENHIDYICESKNNISNSGLSYSCIIFLLEHHFDVFGLIDQGLAIDINTLNK